MKYKSSKKTTAVHAGMKPEDNHGIPNPPVYHTSTIMRPSLDDYRKGKGVYDYGRVGTPTTQAFEEAVAQVYESDDAVAVPSGLAAVACGVMAVVKSADNVLFPDSMYGAARRFVEKILPQYGIEPSFYDPVCTSSTLEARIKPNTSLIFIETPGSITFEIQDTKAIVALAKSHNCLTACDNTWGTAFYFNAKKHGIDVIIESGTKYIGGHSDVSIGVIASSGEVAKKVRRHIHYLGLCVAPDDHYLALRGLRTMPLRLQQSGESGLALARWLEQQPEVIAMRHPALPSHPQHALWKRDFTGASGLFSFYLDAKIGDAAVDAMVDGFSILSIGASWGGHESLITQDKFKRSETQPLPDRLLRIYAGIEDTEDLLADLSAGFERMRAQHARDS